MKYLEGSSFTVHVGGSAYAEGWDRIFGKAPAPALPVRLGSEPVIRIAVVGCFGCELIHINGRYCGCMCHALDGAGK